MSANTNKHLSSRAAKQFLAMAAAMGVVACGTNASQQTTSVLEPLYAPKPHNFRLSLTDAPNKEIKSVFVNVKQAEMRVAHEGKEARLIVAQNLGAVDLLTLQNGVTLPMADLAMPENVTISQIRLVLEEEGNYIIKEDGSRCDLKTPSAQKTGVKFIINGGVTIEEGYSYSIVADFDAKKSIVLQGNGGCLLKPVLKLKSASRIVLPPPPTPTPVPSPTPSASPSPTPSPTPTPTPAPDESTGGGQEEALKGEGDSTQGGDETGFDNETETELPPGMTYEEYIIQF